MAAEEIERPTAPVAARRAMLPSCYALQIAAVTLYIGAALLVVEEVGHLPVVSAIASSAFLVFCLPTATMSKPRNVLGGYVTAVLVAGLFSQLTGEVGAQELKDVIAALAVGASLLMMAVMKTEHVPAAGTTLALTLGSWSWEVAASTLLLAVLLVLLHTLGRGRLMNSI